MILLCFSPRAKVSENCERVCFGAWGLGARSSLREILHIYIYIYKSFHLLSSAWLKSQLKLSCLFVGLLGIGSVSLNFGCCPAPRKTMWDFWAGRGVNQSHGGWSCTDCQGLWSSVFLHLSCFFADMFAVSCEAKYWGILRWLTSAEAEKIAFGAPYHQINLSGTPLKLK